MSLSINDSEHRQHLVAYISHVSHNQRQLHTHNQLAAYTQTAIDILAYFMTQKASHTHDETSYQHFTALFQQKAHNTFTQHVHTMLSESISLLTQYHLRAPIV